MTRSTPRVTKYAVGLLLLATLFVFRLLFLQWQESHETVGEFVGRMAVVEGVVVAEPDRRERALRITVDVATVNAQGAEGKVLVSLPREEEVTYGDRVVVRGLLELPESFETETGRTFDYAGYLHVRGVGVLMPHGTLRERVESAPSLLGALYSFKNVFQSRLEALLPEPQVSLLKGVVLGERGGLSQELLHMFVIVGLIHIVVLSGSNISIVAEGVFRLLGFLPRTLTYLLGGGVLVLFVLMTGSGAAAVRALIMATIALLARYLRRPELALRALIIAAAVLLLWNPLFITDSGFVLSILATFGLITLSPAIERRLKILPAWKHFNLRSIVASTIAVEVFLLPALLYYSGVLSLVALPTNILVLPWIWLVMLLGFVVGLLALLHPTLAVIPTLVLDLALRALLGVAHFASSLPFAATFVAPFPGWVAVLVYLPLIYLAWRVYKSVVKVSAEE